VQGAYPVRVSRGKRPTGWRQSLIKEADAMEMHQVRYFLALSEMLNFTKAAERCKVAQPSLTRAIQFLEIELG
jgi:DNA-binding MarR family transcriptional regulator